MLPNIRRCILIDVIIWENDEVRWEPNEKSNHSNLFESHLVIHETNAEPKIGIPFQVAYTWKYVFRISNINERSLVSYGTLQIIVIFECHYIWIHSILLENLSLDFHFDCVRFCFDLVEHIQFSPRNSEYTFEIVCDEFPGTRKNNTPKVQEAPEIEEERQRNAALRMQR